MDSFFQMERKYIKNAILLIAFGSLLLCARGESFELTSAVRHPPSQRVISLKKTYKGVITTAYSRNSLGYNTGEEKIEYNILINFDIPDVSIKASSSDQARNQNRFAFHGLALDFKSGQKDGAGKVPAGRMASFQNNLPSVSGLSAIKEYSMLARLLTRNGPFLTDAWGSNEGLHKPMGWRCFNIVDDKFIQILDVSCDVFFPGFIDAKNQFQSTGAPVITSIVIKSGMLK